MAVLGTYGWNGCVGDIWVEWLFSTKTSLLLLRDKENGSGLSDKQGRKKNAIAAVHWNSSVTAQVKDQRNPCFFPGQWSALERKRPERPELIFDAKTDFPNCLFRGCKLLVGRDSPVGIATCCVLDGPSIRIPVGGEFSRTPALRPTQPPLQGVSGVFPWSKAAGAWR